MSADRHWARTNVTRMTEWDNPINSSVKGKIVNAGGRINSKKY